MVTQWVVILAAIVLLAIGVAGGGGGVDDEKTLLARECCNNDKLTPAAFKSIQFRCLLAVKRALFARNKPSRNETGCAMIECYMNENELINKEDKTVNEEKTREVFLETADPALKSVMKDALDECFLEHNNNPEKGKFETCNSRADTLVRCIKRYNKSKCPEELWSTSRKKPQCNKNKNKSK